MKTKTTLAALLLAAVMVTPSYGAEKYFTDGAKAYLDYTDGNKQFDRFSMGYFLGYVRGNFHGSMTSPIFGISFPKGKNISDVYEIAARYVCSHPDEHDFLKAELVRRAVKEAWPMENKILTTSK